MKYLKLFEDFNPISREEKVDILTRTTNYSLEDLNMMSDDELDNLYGEGEHNVPSNTDVPEHSDMEAPVGDEIDEPVGPGADSDDDYEKYRADGPMTREELRALHNQDNTVVEKKKMNAGLQAYLDKKKGGVKKDDKKPVAKKDDKKPVAKKDDKKK